VQSIAEARLREEWGERKEYASHETPTAPKTRPTARRRLARVFIVSHSAEVENALGGKQQCISEKTTSASPLPSPNANKIIPYGPPSKGLTQIEQIQSEHAVVLLILA
jgi:hypothetical protein